MESTDSSTGSQQPNLPPGFRFHPTDEELVVHYLKKKAASAPLPVSIIAEVDLYKFDPWELPAKATFGEQEWYFFSPRDRKYPNGARPNRAATSGYWKATGTDKPVLTSGGTQKVGVKKALVFYGGKPPRGIKTNWIMHEYRLADNKPNNRPPGCDLGNKKNSLRLDDWVLCRIYKKNNTHRSPMEHDREDSMDDMIGGIPPSINVGHTMNANRFHHFSKMSTTYTSTAALLETDHHNHHSNTNTLLEGIMLGGNTTNSAAHHHHLGISASNSNNNSASKRTLSSLYWNEEEVAAAAVAAAGTSSSNKRFNLESDDNNNHHGSVVRTDQENNNGSFATLLNQLPQTPSSLHQQTMIGSIGDGLLRTPYQIPGMNWYA